MNDVNDAKKFVKVKYGIDKASLRENPKTQQTQYCAQYAYDG